MSEASDEDRAGRRGRRRVAAPLHGALRVMGYELRPYRTPEQIRRDEERAAEEANREADRTPEEEDRRRAKLLSSRGISLLLDVGANTGQYAIRTRRAGYTGRIVSFEPLASAFGELIEQADPDPDWECRRHGLGSSDGSAEINVSVNLHSSSLLEIEDRHVRAAPEAAFRGSETIELAQLDSVWDEVVRPDDTVFLKLDVQGYELEVLAGAQRSLPSIEVIQTELSLVPLYQGGAGYREVMDRLDRTGFRLAGLEPEFADPETGELLQVNGLFVRG